MSESLNASVTSPPLSPVSDPDYVVDVIDHVDQAWDTLISGFSDVCPEQSVAYMATRWGSSRLCGLVMRGAMTGEPEAAALVLVAAIPLVRSGLAYVKFGPLWRRKDRPVQPSVLGSALSALKQEFSGLRGLLTRVLPPAEPEFALAWKQSLGEAGFRPGRMMDHPDRYLVDLSLSEKDQLASLGAKWRANLRKVGNDVTVREADPIRDLQIFLQLYVAMSDRKQFDDRHHIEALPRFMEAAEFALRPRLFLAYCGTQPVAGSIIVGSGDRAFVPYSATSAEALPLRAGYALRWSVINALRGSPARWLDLGGDEGDEGLRHFKVGNVGKRGAIAAIPAEYDCTGSKLSSATAAAVGWAQRLVHSRSLARTAAQTEAPSSST